MSRPDNEDPNDRLEETARELRKHRPRPSAALVARVERLAERQREPRRAARPRMSRRRLVFALAAALGIALIGAVVAGELRQSPQPVASRTTRHGSGGGTIVLGNPFTPEQLGVQKSLTRHAIQTYSSGIAGTRSGANRYGAYVQTAAGVPRGAQLDALAGRPSMVGTSGSSIAGITTGNRLADLRATLLLKVENRDQLSKQTARAMHIIKSLGGHVVTVLVNAPSRGVATSYLVLKVPAKYSQEALTSISALGKILSQKASLTDVQSTVTSEDNVIGSLKRAIASLVQTLNNQSLTTQARSQLQIHLANDRAELNSLRIQRKNDILRGRVATITLHFTTGGLTPLAAHHSRLHKALNRAWDGLSSEISWAAMGLIVASPFILLGLLLAMLIRFRRRSEERRLLEK
ncbi:MAG: DUF4349 domain-containing protein [Gaiellaceae bacterium]|jgi:hypothetical protein